MHTLHGTSGRIVHVLEGLIPLEGDSGGASHAGLAGHATGGRVAGEVLGEDGAVIILLLVLRRVDGEALGGMGHLLVGNCLGGDLLQGVDPTIAYAIAELLLLAPGNLGGEHRGKGLAHNLLLHGRARTHLSLGVGAHGYIEELLVEEGHTTLNTPGGEALIGAQTVVHIQLAEFANGLFVEVLGGRRLVEVEVAAEDLVGTLATEHHLDTHGLDDAGQQIHGGRGADGGDIVSLDEVDDIADGIEALLDGIVDFVMDGTDMIGHETGLGQIGGALQTHGKGVETGPIGLGLGVVLDTHLGVFLGDG